MKRGNLKRKAALKARSPKKPPDPSSLPLLPKPRARVRIPKAGEGEHQSFRFIVLAKNRGICAWPRCRQMATDPHHVVFKRHCPPGRKYDATDGLPLCRQHHWTHHYGNEKLPAKALLPENLEFAREVLGPAADDYLARHYAAEDERTA